MRNYTHFIGWKSVDKGKMYTKDGKKKVFFEKREMDNIAANVGSFSNYQIINILLI